MNTLSPESTNRPHWRTALGLAAATLLAVTWGGAYAQTPPATVNVAVAVAPATGPAPAGTCTTTNNYYICVNPDPVKTAGAPGADVKIVWKLTGAGWTFVKNKGIDIKNRKDWKLNEDFTTQYTATNKKEDGAQIYKYDVNVTNGPLTLHWDPTIMN